MEGVYRYMINVYNIALVSSYQILEGHSDEIFSCSFNYEGTTIITG